MTKCFVSIGIFGLIACTPKFDWREVRNEDNFFQVLLPGKAASANREINLNGIKATMYMTATDVEHISFSVAYVRVDNQNEVPEASKKQQEFALSAMKTGMVNNIQGQWVSKPEVDLPKDTVLAYGQSISGKKLIMVARFQRKDPYLIQVVMIGEEKAFKKEAAEMFFDSFKWNR